MVRRVLRGRGRLIIIISLVLFVVAISCFATYFLFFRQSIDTNSKDYTQLQTLLNSPAPESKQDKQQRYMEIANKYSNLEDKQKNLEYLLKADEQIQDRTLATGQSLNESIAKAYEAIGDRKQARNYYQLEYDRYRLAPFSGAEYEKTKNFYKEKRDSL